MKKGVIPLSEPDLSGNEWRYVKKCLDSGWVSSAGSFVTDFEEAVASYIGRDHAVATVNGTAALHVSLVASGVTEGDEVIVPALTFIAPVNAVRYCGAGPVFMDCEPETLCINTDKLSQFLSERCERRGGFTCNRTTGRRVRALIAVHVFGHPAEMGEIVEICRKNNIILIEDAAESLGSEYRGVKTGAFGDAGCLSFNGNKIVTAGGGGMVVTNDRGLAQRVRHLTTQAKIEGSVEYDHDEIGFNYRLTGIQAALGLAQMERLDEFVDVKRENAVMYRALLDGADGVEMLWERPWVKSNFWFYTLKVRGARKEGLMAGLLDAGVQSRPLWKPIHTLAMYGGCEAYDIVDAVDAYKTCVNIPCGAGLGRAEIEFVSERILSFLKHSGQHG